MGTKIKWETAKRMMDIVAFTAGKTYIDKNEELDIEAIQQFTRNIFKEYCDAMDITEVGFPEEEEEYNDDCSIDCPYDCDCAHCPYDDVEEDDEEEISGEDEMETLVYDMDGYRGISKEDAQLLVDCVKKIVYKQFSFLPEELKEFMMKNEALRIANDYGIEMVDYSEDE